MQPRNTALVTTSIALTLSVQAATITITPTVKAYWPYGADPFSTPSTPVRPDSVYNLYGTFQIDIKVKTELSASDVAAGWTGLGKLSFSLVNQGRPIFSPDLTYTPYLLRQNAAGTRVSYSDPMTGATMTSGSGVSTTRAVVTAGGDLGTSSTDYQGLYFEAGGVQTSIGKTLTQSSQDPNVTSLLGYPMSIGTFLVNLNVAAESRLISLLNPGEGALLTDGNGNFQTVDESGGNTFRFGSLIFFLDHPPPNFPEPTNIALAAIGGATLIRRRRN